MFETFMFLLSTINFIIGVKREKENKDCGLNYFLSGFCCAVGLVKLFEVFLK